MKSKNVIWRDIKKTVQETEKNIEEKIILEIGKNIKKHLSTEKTSYLDTVVIKTKSLKNILKIHCKKTKTIKQAIKEIKRRKKLVLIIEKEMAQNKRFFKIIESTQSTDKKVCVLVKRKKDETEKTLRFFLAFLSHENTVCIGTGLLYFFYECLREFSFKQKSFKAVLKYLVFFTKQEDNAKLKEILSTVFIMFFSFFSSKKKVEKSLLAFSMFLNNQKNDLFLLISFEDNKTVSAFKSVLISIDKKNKMFQEIRKRLLKYTEEEMQTSFLMEIKTLFQLLHKKQIKSYNKKKKIRKLFFPSIEKIIKRDIKRDKNLNEQYEEIKRISEKGENYKEKDQNFQEKLLQFKYVGLVTTKNNKIKIFF